MFSNELCVTPLCYETVQLLLCMPASEWIHFFIRLNNHEQYFCQTNQKQCDKHWATNFDIIPNCGHMIMLERSEEVYKSMKGFVF